MTAGIEWGYVTIRNEDGTQYFSEYQSWSESYRDRIRVSRQAFDIMALHVEDSKKNDCPDNGFFGLWNLTFHAWK